MTDIELKAILARIDADIAQGKKLNRDWRYAPWFLVLTSMATATAFILAVTSLLARHAGAFIGI